MSGGSFASGPWLTGVTETMKSETIEKKGLQYTYKKNIEYVFLAKTSK